MVLAMSAGWLLSFLSYYTYPRWNSCSFPLLYLRFILIFYSLNHSFACVRLSHSLTQTELRREVAHREVIITMQCCCLVFKIPLGLSLSFPPCSHPNSHLQSLFLVFFCQICPLSLLAFAIVLLPSMCKCTTRGILHDFLSAYFLTVYPTFPQGCSTLPCLSSSTSPLSLKPPASLLMLTSSWEEDLWEEELKKTDVPTSISCLV